MSAPKLFIEVEELIVPVIQHRDVADFYSIVLDIDCKTKESSERILKYLPVIRDRFFWDLYVLLGVIWSPVFRTDIVKMKKRLLDRLETLIDEDLVNDVLIIGFQQHDRRNFEF